MKTNTSQKIITLLKKAGRLRVHDLVRELGLSSVALHKQLKKLVYEGRVTKIGKPPLVYYSVTSKTYHDQPHLGAQLQNFLEENYLYLSPSGEFLSGSKGFAAWCSNTGQQGNLPKLAHEYQKLRLAVNKRLNHQVLFDCTNKLQSTFKEVFLKQIFCQDFYSLPKFGKTKLGQLVLLAKQSQKLSITSRVVQKAKPKIAQLIKDNNLQAIFFIPPTIPRKLQLMKEFSTTLNLKTPQHSFIKLYRDIPVAQKSLNKLEERIINVEETLFLPPGIKAYSKVLLVDDAIGSGATLNEAARKLKEQIGIKTIIGYAAVGSYKGFDVIREI
jgi:predicted amidophosphoribosyltransferase